MTIAAVLLAAAVLFLAAARDGQELRLRELARLEYKRGREDEASAILGAAHELGGNALVNLLIIRACEAGRRETTGPN